MSRLVVRCFAVSLDGYGAGPDQSRAAPMGVGSEALHAWFIPTRTFQHMIGKEGGTTGVNEDFAAKSFENLGAWVMGRNMFTWERGAWSDPDWRGWWGAVPPYHCDVFVLTHHPRDSLAVADTTFHFVTGGLAEAVERAKTAAQGKDVRLGGGVETLRAGFAGRMVDDAHIAVSDLLMGRGEALWPGLDLPALGYRLASATRADGATHLRIVREDA
jgi:dihydrofolate reductase